MVCHCTLAGTKSCESCTNLTSTPVEIHLGSTDEKMHEDSGVRRMLFRSSENIARILEQNRILRKALEAALWYCEDIEILRDARAMTTQYVWVRHRAPYPVDQMRDALLRAGKEE